jgi:hypothetical protein
MSLVFSSFQKVQTTLKDLLHQCGLPCFEVTDLRVMMFLGHRAKMIDGDGSEFYLDTHQVSSDADDE